MSHLGERVASLVDGQLPPEAAERAHIHLAGCTGCREAVELERLTKQRLGSLGAPQPPGDLLFLLLDLAGPSGPLPPRAGHVPGSPRPQLTSTGIRQRPLGRRGTTRPPPAPRPDLSRMVRLTRSSRNRVAAVVVGAACLVGAGAAGGIADGVARAQTAVQVAPLTTFVVAPLRARKLPFTDQSVDWGVARSGR